MRTLPSNRLNGIFETALQADYLRPTQCDISTGSVMC
jgi:hypothetical protein